MPHKLHVKINFLNFVLHGEVWNSPGQKGEKFLWLFNDERFCNPIGNEERWHLWWYIKHDSVSAHDNDRNVCYRFMLIIYVWLRVVADASAGHRMLDRCRSAIHLFIDCVLRLLRGLMSDVTLGRMSRESVIFIRVWVA
jgi:hypothetical protein